MLWACSGRMLGAMKLATGSHCCTHVLYGGTMQQQIWVRARQVASAPSMLHHVAL